MKHLNAIQLEIESLAGRIKPISDSQKGWAMKTFLYRVNIGNRDVEKGCVCPECHERIPIEDSIPELGLDMRCPECGAKIHVFRSYNYIKGRYRNEWVKKQGGFFTILSSVGDWQVCRLVWMQRDCYAKKPNTDWYFAEVCQAWNRPDITGTYFRTLPKSGQYDNPYSMFDCRYEKNEHGRYVTIRIRPHELEARMPDSNNFFRLNNIVPNGKIAPSYRKIGMSMQALRFFRECEIFGQMSGKEYRPMYETLMKGHAYALFDEIRVRCTEEDRKAIFTAYKICLRNGYDYAKNLETWIDCVKMLRSLGMDYHNPVYVCPNNLDALHQQLVARKRRLREIEEAKRRKKDNEELEKRVEKYMGMDIEKNGIRIIVLPNVVAFMQEGDALGHCVYTCGYYSHQDSLILSARCGKKRLETIEVDIKDLRIRQCYGYGNKPSARHEEILSLMNDNMWQVKECRDGKTASVAS